MTKTILYATGNQSKFEHIITRLGNIPGHVFAMKKPLGYEIQSPSIREVCLHKAQTAFAQFQTPLFVHDVGMKLSELNGFPGAYFKDFVGTIPFETLFRMFSHFKDRRVFFEDWLIYMDENGKAHEFMHDTGPALVLCDVMATQYAPSHPMNALTAFADTPHLSGAEDPAFFDHYDDKLLSYGILPCWTQFREFLTAS